MNEYIIYCTQEQTKKALKLGAPIDFRNGDKPFISVEYFDEDGKLFYHNYDIPTAEQMIEWLEESGDIYEISILRNRAFHSWAFLVISNKDKIISANDIYRSRKEATIASINAALEYLDKNKK